MISNPELASATRGSATEGTKEPPVVELLQRRRDRAVSGGGRDDGARVALAVEGGGMRGVVAAAMMTALRDQDLVDSFDDIYTLSAGSINGAYLISGGSLMSVYYDHLTTPDFLDYRRLLTHKPILSLDYVVDEVLGALNPLDYDAILHSPIRLHVATASVSRLEPRVFSEFRSASDLRLVLRASCCLPWIAGRPVDYDGDRLLDGGVLMPHPLVAALADGCTHVVVIRTRQWEAETSRPTLESRIIACYMERMRPGLGAAFLACNRSYGPIRDRAIAGSQHREGPPYLLDVACEPGAHHVKRFTMDRGVLYEGMRAGYRAMLRALTGRDQLVELRPVTADQR
jgi:predicted patatin/cPLA2 family phospholipase